MEKTLRVLTGSNFSIAFTRSSTSGDEEDQRKNEDESALFHLGFDRLYLDRINCEQLL